MYKVEYLVNGVCEDEALEVKTESEALSIAAEWAREGRYDADYIKDNVKVTVCEVTPIAEFPIKEMG